jgi:hypothetical protein
VDRRGVEVNSPKWNYQVTSEALAVIPLPARAGARPRVNEVQVVPPDNWDNRPASTRGTRRRDHWPVPLPSGDVHGTVDDAEMEDTVRTRGGPGGCRAPVPALPADVTAVVLLRR